MKVKTVFKDVVFAVVFVSVLGLVVMQARCVIDEDEEHHGGFWWACYAYVAGERDGIYPNKYFWEYHWGYTYDDDFFAYCDYTEIEFKSDRYDEIWYNNDEYDKDKEYNEWCGYAKTISVGDFHDWAGFHWRDTVLAAIKATGGPGK